MNFFERAIRRGVSDAVGKAVEEAVSRAVEPTATDLANRAANAIDSSVQNTEQSATPSNRLESAMANFERSVQNYAAEAAKNIKLCANCQNTVSAEKKFCPKCGTVLPEQTLAEGVRCSSCGKQNTLDTRFCQDCGAKLPVAIREEQAQADRNAAVMIEWEEKLPQYPKWSCGGDEMYLEAYEENEIVFSVVFRNKPQLAHKAVDEYRQLLLQNGFIQAGQFPSIDQLFKRINGVVYNVDTEHCFDGDPDCACVGFCIREPYGGFDYVKAEPKKKTGFRDLFGL